VLASSLEQQQELASSHQKVLLHHYDYLRHHVLNAARVKKRKGKINNNDVSELNLICDKNNFSMLPP
jgi:hypothetical protein